MMRMMAAIAESMGEEHRGGPHRGQRGAGGPPWGFPFGPGGGPWGRGRKARRGDIRTAVLLLLAEEPRNGYQIMQEVQERSEGAWRPSPGSVYPALSQLEDEGLIRPERPEEGAGVGRRFLLTDAGQEYLAQRDPEAKAPWEHFSEDLSGQAGELGRLLKEVAFAFAQIMRSGTESQLAEARKVLGQAKRDLYRILAEDAPEEG
jgi:DNA-binding PadR family transcriptional regulator